MVFTSVPLFQDPPNNNNNWSQQQAQHQQQTNHHNQQQQNLHQGIITTTINGNHPHDQHHLPLPTIQASGGAAGIRPGSMADRARMAKLPQPEISLKCPRCDSTNTKFCYFNNYSLSQPRHFCKTCRRYWTRGGALRNVPVGGGCRRNNKRSTKSNNSSKSPVKTGSGGTSTSSIPSNSGTTTDIIGQMQQNHQSSSSQLPNFMASLQHHYGEMGFNFGGIFHHPTGVPTADQNVEFNMGSNNSSVAGISLSSRVAEQWRLQQLQQFPFLAGLEPPPGLYPFDGEAGGEPPTYVGGGGGSVTGQMRANKPSSSMGMHSNGVSSVKMEENNQQAAGGMNLSRQFLGIQGSEHQYLGSAANNAWTDLSGFNSSSNSHLL